MLLTASLHLCRFAISVSTLKINQTVKLNEVVHYNLFRFEQKIKQHYFIGLQGFSIVSIQAHLGI